jgi:hygromycin-B 4-O-kinase
MMPPSNTVDVPQAQAFLTRYLGEPPSAVAQIGAGAWSQCFGFSSSGRDLVIRFGKYVIDFQKDQRAHQFARPELPIPEVLDIGSAFDGYYAVSTRAHGVPLESVSVAQWRALVPAVVAALEAMRTTDLSSTHGFGGWGVDGHAEHASWSDRLLAVQEDTPDQRGHGWRARLATSPEGEAAFCWGLDLLEQVVDDDVPRSLLHCDLTNRNVLVQGGQISGVFDWGCSIYGDHLYELALFEFWAPWQPALETDVLKSALLERWAAQGYRPENQAARLLACHLHIGLEHLAYHASLNNWPMVEAVARRMHALAEA